MALLSDYSGKGRNSVDALTGDQELEVRTATYGQEIDQLQHAVKIIKLNITYGGSERCFCRILKTFQTCKFTKQGAY